MYWANFLHIYQPANQTKDILDRVVSESYIPLIKSLLDNPKTKITLNINGALTERLEMEGYKDLLSDLRKVSENGQIEFTDSAKYHALLPFLPEDEIERQITLNRETNRRIIGESYQPVGFFPPEMAYSSKMIPILEKMGYKWIILDEIAYNGKLNQLNKSVVYSIKNSTMKVFFRERGPSNLIMSAMVREEKDLRYYMKEDYAKKDYMITGMDGETFGHHRPGLQKLLTQLLISKEFKHVFLSELPTIFTKTEEVIPVDSTWASSEKDIEEKIQFISWNEPNNEIQKYQWELQKLALTQIKSNSPRFAGEAGLSNSTNKSNLSNQSARSKLDIGLASDQFFWSSGRPWWSLEVIELGAWTLVDAIKSLPQIDPAVIKKAEDLYLKIIATAFEWQRSGHIRELSHQMKETARIPFKDKTAHEPWVYQAFLDLIKKEMKKAAQKEDYEEAILWRDAIWKLETKNDIFDAIHAVDLLRRQVTDVEIKKILDKYTPEYKKIVSGQPEQRAV